MAWWTSQTEDFFRSIVNWLTDPFQNAWSPGSSEFLSYTQKVEVPLSMNLANGQLNLILSTLVGFSSSQTGGSQSYL